MLRVRQHFETPCRPVDPYERVTYSLAMQFVQFVVLTEWSALWARPRDDASSMVGLDLSHAFCIDIFHASALINSSQFSHFCCFSPPASTVGLSGFPLSCQLRSSLFHASLRRVARPRLCSLSHGFRLRLKKGYHLAVSACWNQSSTKNRAGETKPSSSFDLS